MEAESGRGRVEGAEAPGVEVGESGIGIGVDVGRGVLLREGVCVGVRLGFGEAMSIVIDQLRSR